MRETLVVGGKKVEITAKKDNGDWVNPYWAEFWEWERVGFRTKNPDQMQAFFRMSLPQLEKWSNFKDRVEAGRVEVHWEEQMESEVLGEKIRRLKWMVWFDRLGKLQYGDWLKREGSATPFWKWSGGSRDEICSMFAEHPFAIRSMWDLEHEWKEEDLVLFKKEWGLRYP